MKCLGIDVCKASIVTALLESYPSGGLANFWKSSSKNKGFYKTFYSVKKDNCLTSWDFIAFLKAEKPDLAILEPTGNYSKLWRTILTHCDIPYKLVGHVELKRYHHKIAPSGHTKNDSLDSLCMASYPFDPENLTSDSLLNNSKFIREVPEIERLRDLVFQLEFSSGSRVRFGNYLKSRMSREFPERQDSQLKPRYLSLPPLLLFMAGRHDEMNQVGRTRLTKEWNAGISNYLGIELDNSTSFFKRTLSTYRL
ncbi:MAG: IS110 family transposase [Oscillatoriales cyanobacterium RM1_1_9]|nr:IS110 family transposase [Oscillatoriales cyanobacterium RM1_1_9]